MRKYGNCLQHFHRNLCDMQNVLLLHLGIAFLYFLLNPFYSILKLGHFLFSLLPVGKQ